jgi:putative Holliday junction resolvase
MPKKKKKAKTSKDEKLMAIDYGSKNIGIAFGTNGFVNPVKVVNGTNTQMAINEIARFLIENRIDKIIVGLPLTAEGKETAQSMETRQFVKMLKIIVKKPVEFYNEFGTTQEALHLAIETGIPQKRRQTKDHLSAAIILKRYFQEVEHL